MRTRRATGALLAAMALACMSEPAHAAPVKGAYYVGHAPGVSQPLYLRVAADGRRLTTYVLGAKVACSDGEAREFALNEVREKRFGLTADGRFDFRSVSRFTHRGGKRPITGTDAVRIVGAFAGDQADLRIEIDFRGPTTCAGTMPVTFTRVGSPALPAQDDLVSTGRYRQAGGLGAPVQVSPFRTVGPARLVEGLTIRWEAFRCTRGFRYRDAYPFAPLLLDSRATLRLSVRDRYPVRGGYRARLRARLVIGFDKAGSTYLGNGTWQATTRLYRRGRHVGTCSLPALPFRLAAR